MISSTLFCMTYIFAGTGEMQSHMVFEGCVFCHCSRSSSRDRKRSRWEDERDRRSESSSGPSRERAAAGGGGGGGNGSHVSTRSRESEEAFAEREREREKGEEEKEEEELLKPAWIRCTHAESYYSNDPMDQVVPCSLVYLVINTLVVKRVQPCRGSFRD